MVKPLLHVCYGGNNVDLVELKQQCEPIFTKHDVICYDMIWRKEQQDRVLEISIYKKGVPTDIETCVSVSHQISALLDEVNPFDFEYVLDVCSAGIERELKNEEQLQDALYHQVNVKVENPVNKRHVIEGKLTKITDETIEVLTREKHKEVTATIERSNILKIRMAVKF